MERRDFLKKFGIGVGATVVMLPTFANIVGNPNESTAKLPSIVPIKSSLENPHYVFEILNDVPSAELGGGIDIYVGDIGFFACGDNLLFQNEMFGRIVSVDKLNSRIRVYPYSANESISPLSKGDLFLYYSNSFSEMSDSPSRR